MRILRTARFASRFNSLGFNIAHETVELMKKMVSSGEVDSLIPERVFKELSLSIESEKPSIFFEVLIESGAYQRLFPMLDINKTSDMQILDVPTELPEVRFALWLHKQNTENVLELCDHLKCPKDFQQIAELVAEWHHFAKALLSYSPDEILNFYLKNDGLRRQRRFQIILTAFDYLEINTKPINELLELLKGIEISKLDNLNIAQELTQERLSVIARFLDPTK